ncbi:MAG TPA: nickel ABC transporter permease [bacterium]|nr:nickel ABC transporter permease [bacterium]
MHRYIAQRLLQLVPVLLSVSILVFLMIHLVPGDPVQVMLQDYGSAEQAQALRHTLGLDRPLPLQFGLFVWRLAHGDLGRSIRTGRPVASEIALRLPYTLRLTAASMVVAIALGLVFGTLAAIHHRRLLDYAATVVALAGISLPSFWFGLVLILIFSYYLRWLPPAGADTAGSLILPAVTLGTGAASIIARLCRSSLLEVLRQEFIRTARAKGAGELRVLYRHGLRNALIPMLSIVGLQFAGLLGGAVIVESVFGWPGLGRLAVDAIFNRDIPVIQGVVLVAAAIFVAVNLCVDLLYALVDPRIRYV